MGVPHIPSGRVVDTAAPGCRNGYGPTGCTPKMVEARGDAPRSRVLRTRAITGSA